jgi:hypothetical protein
MWTNKILFCFWGVPRNFNISVCDVFCRWTGHSCFWFLSTDKDRMTFHQTKHRKKPLWFWFWSAGKDGLTGTIYLQLMKNSYALNISTTLCYDRGAGVNHPKWKERLYSVLRSFVCNRSCMKITAFNVLNENSYAFDISTTLCYNQSLAWKVVTTVRVENMLRELVLHCRFWYVPTSLADWLGMTHQMRLDTFEVHSAIKHTKVWIMGQSSGYWPQGASV